MRYLVVQDWDNTHGNHAGMVHMCKLLCEKFPGKYCTFIKQTPKLKETSGTGIIRRFRRYFERCAQRRLFAKEYLDLCGPMFSKLRIGDEVFLLEYHLPHVSQYELAKSIKRHYPHVQLYGLTHLTPLWFEMHRGSARMIKRWTRLLDKQLTLGSSLTNYFDKMGIVPKEKLSTGFHYVDIDYYQGTESAINDPMTVISIGALQRDFKLLASIVRGCSGVNWIICKGKKNIDALFDGLPNVRLVGYVEEEDLKKNMSQSDLSLNVLEDTVGSNVITTSMAMGLGLVVSDVGSIRDYCDEESAVFCMNTAESFINAINDLVDNPQKVKRMRVQALRRSMSFNINRVDEWFDSLNTI